MKTILGIALAYSLSLLLLLAPTLAAQGVPTEWEARQKIEALLESTRDIEKVLARIDLARWKQAAAPEAYYSQLESAKKQLASSRQAMEELKGNPEKLATAFEIFLRFQALDHMIASVREATRNFDDPVTSDDLETKVGASFPARDRFQIYLLDLARERDQQFAVLLKEAQRCRVEVNSPPAAKKPSLPATPTTPAVRKP